ncbi:MAB_1171c family putative transporter [Streptomyces sp. CA-111067]|uniref:MAB_1171c family putative transporter n=1 Tax=Streptomyces sp. CA-111067 TaxID=3240046 RepID=UPI003D984884
MLAFLAYFVAGLMTAVAVWRLPALVHGDAHRRALWGCYAGFAAALWLKSPAIMDSLNHSAVTDLAVLLKHYVSIAAILAILTFVVATYGRSDQAEVPRHVAVSRWIERTAWKASLQAAVLMTVLFFTVVDRSRPSNAFVPDHAGQWGATLYMTTFYLYLGTACAVTCYQWSSAARRADTRLLRVGLLMMATAMVIGDLYVTERVAFMWTAVLHPLSEGFGDRVGTWTTVQEDLVFILFAAGASIPATSAAARRWNSWRTLWRLYPLWRALMVAVPGIRPVGTTGGIDAPAFEPPASRLREVLRVSPPATVRVDRWTQDIADAVEQLRHYAPPALLEAAEEASADHPDALAAAEAQWINAVLLAAKAGQRREVASEALPVKAIGDSDAEAAWLLRVEAARAGLTVLEGHRLLHAAVEMAR